MESQGNTNSVLCLQLRLVWSLCALQTKGSLMLSVCCLTDKSQTTIRLQQSASTVTDSPCQTCFCWLACLFIGGLSLWNLRCNPTLTVNPATKKEKCSGEVCFISVCTSQVKIKRKYALIIFRGMLCNSAWTFFHPFTRSNSGLHNERRWLWNLWIWSLYPVCSTDGPSLK